MSSSNVRLISLRYISKSWAKANLQNHSLFAKVAQCGLYSAKPVELLCGSGNQGYILDKNHGTVDEMQWSSPLTLLVQEHMIYGIEIFSAEYLRLGPHLSYFLRQFNTTDCNFAVHFVYTSSRYPQIILARICFTQLFFVQHQRLLIQSRVKKKHSKSFVFFRNRLFIFRKTISSTFRTFR